MRLSVIIPTLNEAGALPQLLAQLKHQRGVELELIVADGGSSDDTSSLAKTADAKLLNAPRGRGRQMNVGARAAAHDWLLFLHADSELRTTTLLADALAALQAQDDLRCAGHFGLRFLRSQPGDERFFAHLEAKTRLNRAGTIHGDQGLLIHRDFFWQLGGYDEQLPYFEDVGIADKIFTQGRWRLLPGELHTSARRFEREGPRARYTLMALMMGLHAAGVREFFTQAPQLYRAQGEAQELDLRPFVHLARRLLAQGGRWRILCAAGAYVRANAWQLFFWRDQRRGDGRLACLEFHDRHLAARLHRPFFDQLTALLLAAWFYIWLPLELRVRR